jgi:hypothetical protein
LKSVGALLGVTAVALVLAQSQVPVKLAAAAASHLFPEGPPVDTCVFRRQDFARMANGKIQGTSEVHKSGKSCFQSALLYLVQTTRLSCPTNEMRVR